MVGSWYIFLVHRMSWIVVEKSSAESLGLGLIRAVVVLPRPTLERMQSNLSWSDRFVSGTYLDDHSNFYLVTSLSDGEHHYQSGPFWTDSLDRRDTKWDSINVTQKKTCEEKNMWGKKQVRKKHARKKMILDQPEMMRCKVDFLRAPCNRVHKPGVIKCQQ